MRFAILKKNPSYLPSIISKILDRKKNFNRSKCNFQKKNAHKFISKLSHFLPWKKIPYRGITYPFPRPVELEVHPPGKQWLKWKNNVHYYSEDLSC